MDEYIERRKAVEWFMAFVYMGEDSIPVETVLGDLKYAIPPAVDAVPVVRCFECTKRHTVQCGFSMQHEDGNVHTWETDTDYCCLGKRRADDAQK